MESIPRPSVPDKGNRAMDGKFWVEMILGLVLIIAGLAMFFWFYGWITSKVDPIWFILGAIVVGLVVLGVVFNIPAKPLKYIDFSRLRKR